MKGHAHESQAARGNGYVISRDLKSRLVSLTGLQPLGRDTRKHPPGQIRKLAASLDRFGFVLPILTDQASRVVAGWGLVLAARHLGLTAVPAISLTDLSEAKLRALRLALNRISKDGDWDREALKLEFSDILDLEPDIELANATGFEVEEIDCAFGDGGANQEDHLDALPSIPAASLPVTRAGDLWLLGQHRLFCGDASMPESYRSLLGTQKADMMFADPPSEMVARDNHRAGLGMGMKDDGTMVESGELASPARLVLRTFFEHAARFSKDGAIHFVCVDWRHAKEVILAGEEIFGRPKDVCVWTKAPTRPDAHPRSLYISQHELIFVFTVGGDAHIDNGPLARGGRTRTNVWDYAGQAPLDKTARSKRGPRLIPKPVAMVAAAIRDCSDRGGVVLDPYGKTGTTLIAAERTGRRARVIESDPILVDLAIERWQGLTGGVARHANSGRPYARTVKVEHPIQHRVRHHGQA